MNKNIEKAVLLLLKADEKVADLKEVMGVEESGDWGLFCGALDLAGIPKDNTSECDIDQNNGMFIPKNKSMTEEPYCRDFLFDYWYDCTKGICAGEKMLKKIKRELSEHDRN